MYNCILYLIVLFMLSLVFFNYRTVTYRFINANTMRQEIVTRIFVNALQICGLAQWTYNLKHSLALTVYSILLIIGFSGFFLETLFNAGDYIDKNQTIVEHVVGFIQSIGTRLCHIFTLIEALCRSKSVIVMMQRISNSEEKLEQMFGFERNFILTKKTLYSRLFLFTVFYIFVLFVGLTFVLVNSKYHLLNAWIFTTISLFVTSLRYLQIYVFVRGINEVLIELTNFVELTSLCSKDSKRVASAIATTFNRNINHDPEGSLSVNEKFAKLEEIRLIYDEATVLCDEISINFGISLLVNLANNFIAVTGSFYWFFSAVLDLNGFPWKKLLTFLGNVVWSMPHMLNVVAIAIVCHWTVERVRIRRKMYAFPIFNII